MKKGTKHSKETLEIISKKVKERFKDKEYVKKVSKNFFKKGATPWNKDMKGIRLSPKSEFKEGQFVGPEHPSWKGGIQIPVADCVYLWNGSNKRVRRPRKIYEEQYGKIPKGYIIWHIDGNKHNDDIDNLEAISRAECMKRNFKKRWNE
jgi:hypothetical protein